MPGISGEQQKENMVGQAGERERAVSNEVKERVGQSVYGICRSYKDFELRRKWKILSREMT